MLSRIISGLYATDLPRLTIFKRSQPPILGMLERDGAAPRNAFDFLPCALYMHGSPDNRSPVEILDHRPLPFSERFENFDLEVLREAVGCFHLLFDVEELLFLVCTSTDQCIDSRQFLPAGLS